MSDATGTTLHLERLIAMPPDALFALWTEPALLAAWWAPEGYEANVHSLDSTPGGRWRVTMRRADGTEVATSGVYRIVEPPHRLCFSWAWEDARGVRVHDTEVTVTFEAVPGGTRLVLLQRRFEGMQPRDNHARGWSGCLDRMAAMAADALRSDDAHDQT